ncbi:hypothetical protein F4801DRAFT_578749 [Xylaria longipes]|nr:hypothetical protein F4801DRAFT_578749 [Xylaria longipes]
MESLTAQTRTASTKEHAHPTQGEPMANKNANQAQRESRLGREHDFDPSAPSLALRNGDEGSVNKLILKRRKTVTFGVATSVPRAPLSYDEHLSVGEYEETLDGEGDQFDPGGLKSIGTGLSRIVTYNGSNGPLPDQLWGAIDATAQAITGDLKAGFIPEEQLVRILNEIAISHELAKIERSLIKRMKFWRTARSAEDIKRDADVICGRPSSSIVSDGNDRETPRCFRKIFAILLLVERPGAIRRFVREGVCDANLPLVKVPIGNNTKTFSLRIERDNKHISLKCFEGWQRRTLELFEETQWKVIAPFFDSDSPHSVMQLDDGIVLPFTYWEHLRTGSQGNIFKVRIHRDHHNFNDYEENHEDFAVKEIRGETEDFQREFRMLKRVNDEHVVLLLATYHYRDHYYFIFPWAKCDLGVYWKNENPEPVRDQNTVLWMARQCRGISMALNLVHRHPTSSMSSLMGIGGNSSTPTCAPSVVPGQPGLRRAPRFGQPLHRFYGVHGDIKPSNLLWFPNCTDPEDMGTIKVSDFGSGEFSRTESTRRPSDSVSYTPSYQQPEINIGPEISISPSYDTWTLGCLFLEFVTWYIGGWKLLREFRRLRRQSKHGIHHNDAFFELTDNPSGAQGYFPPQYTKLKPVVIEHFERLRSSSKSSPFIRDFLAMIETGMLLIEAGSDTADGFRISSAEILGYLEDMVERCEENPRYANRSGSFIDTHHIWKKVSFTSDNARFSEDQVKVTIEFNDGSTPSSHIEYALGRIENQLSVAQLKTNFMCRVSLQIGQKGAEREYEAFTGIGNLTDVGMSRTLY